MIAENMGTLIFLKTKNDNCFIYTVFEIFRGIQIWKYFLIRKFVFTFMSGGVVGFIISTENIIKLPAEITCTRNIN